MTKLIKSFKFAFNELNQCIRYSLPCSKWHFLQPTILVLIVVTAILYLPVLVIATLYHANNPANDPDKNCTDSAK